MKVAVFVGTRADLGPLEPVIDALSAQSGTDLVVLSGVAFGDDELQRLLHEDLGHEVKVAALADPMADFSTQVMVRQGAALAEGMADFCEQWEPDALVVLGDRWELLYVVPTAVIRGIRLIHIHGGEVTEGALDERVRHAVTKLADLHCVASDDARIRVEQMGEEPSRIQLTGAPGLDRLKKATPLTDAELAALVGHAFERPIALFTYHPETASGRTSPGGAAARALRATARSVGTVIATAPGMDAGRDEILGVLDAAAAADSRIVYIESLGRQYPRALAAVDVVVGNSSSGIIEAPTAGVPAVDIGERQRGRLRAESVLHADDDEADIENALRRALSPQTRAMALRRQNPYGDGGAGIRIADATHAALSLSRAKSFVVTEGAGSL